jgi:hypothetical protein
MHLHGHNFYILHEGPGAWDGTIVRPSNPHRRDVYLVRGNGHLVIQFDAAPGTDTLFLLSPPSPTRFSTPSAIPSPHPRSQLSQTPPPPIRAQPDTSPIPTRHLPPFSFPLPT